MKYNIIMYNLIILIATLTCIFVFSHAFGSDNSIVVFYNKEFGQINKNVFGTMFIGDDFAEGNPNYRHHYYGRTDFGSGIWNPARNEPVKEVIDLTKNAGISIIRFYNGDYPWKNTIGKGRKHYLFGMDEFLRTTEEIGAEPLIVLNYFIDNEQGAADLVEYLNAPCDGKHSWAAKRAENGHPDPYNVKYFELGNEVYDSRFGVTPEDYAQRYLKFSEAMKAVDPSVQIGIVLYTTELNRMLPIIKDKADFGIIHLYPTPVWGNKLEQLTPFDVFSLSFAVAPLRYNDLFQEILEVTKELSGKELPLAITEYNVGFTQDRPVPYRHSLGAALINAELLSIFMKPEHKILMANQFHFSNDYFGIIRSEEDFMLHDYRKPIHYMQRPTYYVYELYNKHFGDTLIDADVRSSVYNIKGGEKYDHIKDLFAETKKGHVAGNNLLTKEWNISKVPGVIAEEKNGVLQIDFIEADAFNYAHSGKKVDIHPDTFYRLSGYIKTEALLDKEGICLEVMDKRGLSYLDVNTQKIMGTTDWRFVHVTFKTPPDAASLLIIARRIGREGPLKGKVFIKDVKLERFDPETRVPYLSVNASKSENGDKVYLIVINKNISEATSAFVEIRDFPIWNNIESTSNKDLLQAELWILNGPSIESTNEKKADTVRVVNKKFEINDASFEFTFEPHSLTAIEISRKE